MTPLHFDISEVRTLANALDPDPTHHTYAITNLSTGRIKGVYTTVGAVSDAMATLAGPGTVYVVSVLHPDDCDCEMPA